MLSLWPTALVLFSYNRNAAFFANVSLAESVYAMRFKDRPRFHYIITLHLSEIAIRPFATNDHMVQNPPYWRASSLLFPHWDIKTKRPQSVKRDWPLFLCPSAAIIMSLPSSMADFVPCDRLLQKAYYT